jgi:3-isopropylmalate dehydrogenase
MFKYTFADEKKSQAIENAVRQVLKDGLRTKDIFSEGTKMIGCDAMGDAIIERLDI